MSQSDASLGHKKPCWVWVLHLRLGFSLQGRRYVPLMTFNKVVGIGLAMGAYQSCQRLSSIYALSSAGLMAPTKFERLGCSKSGASNGSPVGKFVTLLMVRSSLLHIFRIDTGARPVWYFVTGLSAMR
jgi:hypothetical protein